MKRLASLILESRKISDDNLYQHGIFLLSLIKKELRTGELPKLINDKFKITLKFFDSIEGETEGKVCKVPKPNTHLSDETYTEIILHEVLHAIQNYSTEQENFKVPTKKSEPNKEEFNYALFYLLDPSEFQVRRVIFRLYIENHFKNEESLVTRELKLLLSVLTQINNLLLGQLPKNARISPTLLNNLSFDPIIKFFKLDSKSIGLLEKKYTPKSLLDVVDTNLKKHPLYKVGNIS